MGGGALAQAGLTAGERSPPLLPRMKYVKGRISARPPPEAGLLSAGVGGWMVGVEGAERGRETLRGRRRGLNWGLLLSVTINDKCHWTLRFR